MCESNDNFILCLTSILQQNKKQFQNARKRLCVIQMYIYDWSQMTSILPQKNSSKVILTLYIVFIAAMSVMNV